MADQTIKLTFSEGMELSYLSLISDKISKDFSNVRLQTLRDSMAVPEMKVKSGNEDLTGLSIPPTEQKSMDPATEQNFIFSAGGEQLLNAVPAEETPKSESAQNPVATSAGPTISSITGYDVADPYSVTVHVTLAGSPSATTYYTMNGSTWTEFSESFTLTQNCQFMVKAQDTSGNQTWSEVLNVTKIGIIDSAGPTIDSITGYDAASSEFVTINVAVSDSGSGVAGTYYKGNGAGWKAFSGSFTMTNNGQFMIKAVDNAGNQTISNVYYVKNISKAGNNGIVQVYSSGTPILTQSAPLIDYLISGTAYQMMVFSAGKTVSLTMTDSSVATLQPEGMMSDTTISSDAILIMRGGITERNTLQQNGKMVVSEGIAFKNSIHGTGATLEVSSGGRVSATNVSGGYLIMKGGNADSNTILNNGGLVVSNGVACMNTVNGTGATLEVSNEGRASATNVTGGGYLVMRGGLSEQNMILENGGLLVSAGSAVSTVISGFNARLEANGLGLVNNVTVADGGAAFLKNGGRMISGQILSSGLLLVSSTGAVSSLSVQSGGVVAFESGAIGSSIHFADGAEVFVSYGANISGLTPSGSHYLLQIGIDSTTNVHLISSGTTYSITNGQMSSATAYAGTYLEVANGGCVRNLRTSGYTEPYGSGAGGAMQLSAGGTGYNVENHMSGQINVFSGGYLSGATTDTEGEIYLYGGRADNLTINDRGFLWIHSGGSAANIHANTGGGVTISSGAQADGVVISNGHVIVEESNAYVSNTQIGNGGVLEICGAHAVNVTISSGGILTYSSSFYPMDVDEPVIALSGQASNVTISSGGLLAAKFTGSATLVHALNGASVQVSSGALVQSLTADPGAQIFIESSGVVRDAAVSSSLLAVKEHASAVNVLAMSGAEVQVQSNAFMQNLNIGANASAIISGGGRLTSAGISAGAVLDIHTGANAQNLIIDSGAIVNIAYSHGMLLGGSANGVAFIGNETMLSGYTVLNGGHLNMLTGSASDLSVSSGGRINISSGAEATEVTVSSAGICYVYGVVSGLTTYFGETHFSDSGYGFNITAVSGYVQVHDGALTDTVTINNDATLIVKTGGQASNVTISSGGLLAAVSSGSAELVHALAGANVQVSSGALVQRLTADPGAQIFIESSGVVRDAAVSSLLAVKGHASAVNVQGSSGAEIQVQSNAFMQNLNIGANASAIISGGGRLTSAGISAGAVLDIHTGANAQNLIIDSGAIVNIAYSHGMLLGGSANGVAFIGNETMLSGYTVLSGGNLNMLNGSGQNLFVSQGGRINISSGAAATNVTVNSAGSCYVYGSVSGMVTNGDTHYYQTGIGTNITVTGAYTQVHDGTASINQATVSSGGLMVFNSGLASNVTVTNSGVLAVYNSGSASVVNVSSGGQAQISSNGMISQLHVSGGGYSVIGEGGGSITSAVIAAGAQLDVYANGVLHGANVSGLLNVAANGSASSIIVSAGATCNINGTVSSLTTYGDTNFNAGAAVSSVQVMGDFAEVNANAAVANMTVSAGQLIVYSGGTVNGLTLAGTAEGDILTGGAVYGLSNNYYLRMQSGARLGGEINLTETGRIFATEGAVVEFSLVGRSTSANYLINNLSRIEWSPSFAISVSSNQAVGTYKLADGATFSGSMTILVNNQNVGSIACNGSFSYGGYTYTLTKSSSILTFSVALAASSPIWDESELLQAESASALDIDQNWQELSTAGLVDSLALDTSDYSDEIGRLLGMQYSEDMTACYACSDLIGMDETASILDKNRSLIA